MLPTNVQRLYSKKTWRMGPYAGVDYNSSYLKVNSVVSYPPPLQRDGVEKISPINISMFLSVC
jgi:hypothetical protein